MDSTWELLLPVLLDDKAVVVCRDSEVEAAAHVVAELLHTDRQTMARRRAVAEAAAADGDA